MKRAQLTLFVIISIIIGILIISFFLIRKDVFYYETFETNHIKDYVEDCIENEGSKIIFRVAHNGGYYFEDDFSRLGAPLYYSNGDFLAPSKEEIELEIENAMNQLLFFCTKNFLEFKNYEISQGEINSKVIIEDEFVLFYVNYPLSIKKEDKILLIDSFEALIPLRLGMLYNSAIDLLNEQNNGICFNCLVDLSIEKDFYVEMADYDYSTMFIVFSDYNSKINDEALRFRFLNKYRREV